MQVKLNQQEQDMLSKLDASTRKVVEEQLLKTKAEALARANKIRNEFVVKVTDKGGISVYGIGNRFPVTLYPESWNIIFANQEAIKSALSSAPARTRKSA